MTPLDREKLFVMCRYTVVYLMTEWEVTTLTWLRETHNRAVGVGWVFPIHFLHLERAAPLIYDTVQLLAGGMAFFLSPGGGKKAEHKFQKQHPPKFMLTIKVIPRHTHLKHDEKQGQELTGIFWVGNN